MKKYLIILSILFLQAYICNAQDRGRHGSNNIEDLKKEYFNKQLRLNPVESRAFWPMYRQYNKDCADAWRGSNGDMNLFTEKVATIKDGYRQNFVAILHSHERADLVYKVERDFRIMVQRSYQQRKRM